MIIGMIVLITAYLFFFSIFVFVTYVVGFVIVSAIYCHFVTFYKLLKR